MDIMEARLTKNLVFIKENLSDNAIDSIIDVLIQKGVIRISDRPSIVAGKPLKDKIQSVVDEVMRKKKYDEFICALSDTNNEHVLQEITSLDDKEFGEFIEKNQEKESTKDEPGISSDSQQRLLTSENDEVAKSYEDIKRENQELKRELEVKCETLENLKSELGIAVQQKDQIATERDKIASEKDSLNDRVKQLEIEIAELRKDLDLKTVQMEKIKSCLEELKDELEDERQLRTNDRKQHDDDIKEIRKQYDSIMNVLNENKGKQNQTQTKKIQSPGYKPNIASNARVNQIKSKKSNRN